MEGKQRDADDNLSGEIERGLDLGTQLRQREQLASRCSLGVARSRVHISFPRHTSSDRCVRQGLPGSHDSLTGGVYVYLGYMEYRECWKFPRNKPPVFPGWESEPPVGGDGSGENGENSCWMWKTMGKTCGKPGSVGRADPPCDAYLPQERHARMASSGRAPLSNPCTRGNVDGLDGRVRVEKRKGGCHRHRSLNQVNQGIAPPWGPSSRFKAQGPLAPVVSNGSRTPPGSPWRPLPTSLFVLDACHPRLTGQYGATEKTL